MKFLLMLRQLRGRVIGLNAINTRFDILQSDIAELSADLNRLQLTIDSIKSDSERFATKANLDDLTGELLHALDDSKDYLKQQISRIGLNASEISWDEKIITKEESQEDVFSKTQQHYEKVISDIKMKAKEGKIINVGFFVLYDSAFPGKPLFKKLENENEFRPILIIIPDTMRGSENMLYQLKKSYDSFSKLYSNVFLGYDERTGVYIDLSEELDFVCLSNPYDCLTHQYFTMEYLKEKNILPFYISYAFSLSKYARSVYRQDSFGHFWRVFTNTNLNLQELEKYAAGHGRNAVVTGYCKMDSLAEEKIVPKKRKTIIIAPHHTVREWNEGLEISNFLSYAEFFLHLPELYPNMDFIFRPHPLLFVALKMEDMWGQQRVAEYLDRLLKNKNIKFSDEDDYFDIFVNSDGMIHDCASFVAEYLFTDHPACFLLKDDTVISKNFAPLGARCLDFHYKAYNESDILNFIDNVVLLGDDTMLEARKKFSGSVLKYNYPNASGKILEYLKETITND